MVLYLNVHHLLTSAIPPSSRAASVLGLKVVFAFTTQIHSEKKRRRFQTLICEIWIKTTTIATTTTTSGNGSKHRTGVTQEEGVFDILRCSSVATTSPWSAPAKTPGFAPKPRKRTREPVFSPGIRGTRSVFGTILKRRLSSSLSSQPRCFLSSRTLNLSNDEKSRQRAKT